MIKEYTMPCIHMNGSGKDSLRKQYNELFEAVSEAQIKLLFDIAMHPRDYYPLGDEAWDKAYSEREEVKKADITELMKKLQELVGESIQIISDPDKENVFIDLSNLNFEKLRELFEKQPMNKTVYDLQKAVGGFKTQDLSQAMGRQFVAGPGALTTQAEGLASGLGGFQPFLNQAAAAETAAAEEAAAGKAAATTASRTTAS